MADNTEKTVTNDQVEVPEEEKPENNPAAEIPEAEQKADSAEKAEKTEEKQEEKPKKPARTERDSLNAARRREYNAERRYNAEREKNLELEKRLALLESRVTGTDKSERLPNGAPDPTKYEYGELDTRYIRDLTRFETEESLKRAESKRKEEESARAKSVQSQERARELANFSAAGEQKFDDFHEVVTQTAGLPPDDPAAWPCSDMLGQLLLTSDLGPDIAYDLASDPKEARRVHSLPLGKQAAWFAQKVGELSAQSPGEGAHAAPKVTKAPGPVKPVRGNGSNVAVPTDTSDFAAFERAYGWHPRGQ